MGSGSRTRLALLALAVLLVASACSSGGGPPPMPAGSSVGQHPATPPAASTAGGPGTASIATELLWTFPLTRVSSRITFDKMAVAPNGHVYVVDAGRSRVNELSSSGKLLRSWGRKGRGRGEFDFTHVEGSTTYTFGGLGIDSKGDVYVSEAGNGRVQKFDSRGRFLLTWGSDVPGIESGHGKFADLIDLAVDAAGRVYTDDDESPEVVQEFTPDGRWLAGFGTGHFQFPTGMGVSRDGHVFVADFRGPKVNEFDSHGAFVGSFGSFGSGGGGLASPVGVGVAPDGGIYVASGAGAIDVFRPDGTFEGEIRGEASGPGAIRNPTSVAVDTEGDVYVFDQSSFLLMKFRIAAAGD